jgi:RNA polymerase sigma-54 factor
MSEISQKLDLRQSQNLVMTPQLQQAIKLLQMNNIELSEFIETQLVENPLLEKEERSSAGEPESSENKEEEQPEQCSDETNREFDEAWAGDENVTDFDPGAIQYGSGGNTSFEAAESGFENTLTREKTLREYLLEQLHMAYEDGRDRMIGTLLIDMLDESGYLRADRKELSERLGCSEQRVENLLVRMKQFEPTGIFASSLEECLALQLEEQGRYDEPMKALLDNLDLLAGHDLKGLADKCQVNDVYLADMIGEIRALNPRPARDYDHFVVQTVVPDVLMRALPKNLGGGWRVELNNDTLPKVLVNNSYYTEVAGNAKDKKDRQYLDQQLSSANWLVKALDQRAQTILKVAGEIVEEQNGFFLYGIEFLKPMTLRDIAGKIDMHESTVSRVTNNKYIGTPRGIFELKYFFSSSLGGAEGSSHSSESVKARIKTLIDGEEPKKILSDDKIVEILKGEGIDIARRTVAKYREALHIPSSVQRRRKKGI